MPTHHQDSTSSHQCPSRSTSHLNVKSYSSFPFFFFINTETPEIYTLSLHDALPICIRRCGPDLMSCSRSATPAAACRSEEHTSELQSHSELVCRLRLEKKNQYIAHSIPCEQQDGTPKWKSGKGWIQAPACSSSNRSS